jgi:UPF0755 protein
MLDDLDLAWEEQQEPRRRGAPQTRQARQRRRKERKRRRRSFGALFISFLLLAGLGGGVYLGVGKLQEMFGAPDYTGNPAQVPVEVTIEQGWSVTRIGEELHAKGVVKSVRAFVNVAEADQERSTKIQPGTYKLFKETQASVVLDQLLDPDKYLLQDRVTIREGLTAIQTFKELAKATGIPEKEFADAAKDPIELGVPDWWYGGDRADGKKNRQSIEGFLFPDTYAFAPEMTASDILKKMVARFNDVAGEVKFADTVQSGLGITPYEALIVASLAQVEAGKEEDFSKISRVAYNRAIKFKDSFPCGCLQFDVTVNYFLEQSGKKTKSSKDMTAAELDNPRNPWNTGASSPGLPVGPISNPGKAALEAAMSPAKGNWLYFVAVDKNGTTKFANTKDEHDNNVLEACRNGVLTCTG